MSLFMSAGGDVEVIDLSENLVAHYLLNNNSDDSTGISESGIDGSIVTHNGESATYTQNVDSYTLTPDDFWGITGAFSVSFWVNPVSPETYRTVYAHGTTGSYDGHPDNGNFSIMYYPDKIIAYLCKNSTDIMLYYTFDTSLQLNQFTHYGFSWDGSTGTNNINLYKNGVFVTSSSQTDISILDSDLRTAAIGSDRYRSGDDRFYLQGDVSNFRVYNSAKDANDFSALYEEGYYPKPLPVPTETGLLAHYPLTGTAEDTTGNYNGTENNTYIDNLEYGSVSDFDGNNCIETTAGATINSSDMTFSCWGKLPSDALTSEMLIAQGGNTDHKSTRGIQYADNYRVIAASRDSAGTYFGVAHTMNVEDQTKWNHFVCIDRGTLTEIWVNGVFIDSIDRSSNYTFIDKITLGAVKDNVGTLTHTLTGQLSNARIYSRALIQAEIEDIYNYEKNFRPIDIDDGLVAFYPLSNNSLDNYYNQYDGTDTGGVTHNTLYSTFNGTDGYINAGPGIADFKIDAHTMMAWVRIPQTQFNVTIIDNNYKAAGADLIYNSGTALTVNGSGRFVCRYNVRYTEETYDSNGLGGSSYVVDSRSSFEVQTDTWYHVCGIVNTDTGRLYINGELDSTVSSVGGVVWDDVDDNFAIGCEKYDSAEYHHFNGDIANVRFYNKVLLPEQIKAIYDIEKGDF